MLTTPCEPAEERPLPDESVQSDGFRLARAFDCDPAGAGSAPDGLRAEAAHDPREGGRDV